MLRHVEFSWDAPLSSLIAIPFHGMSATANHVLFLACWWMHLLILLSFAIYVPQSKHFHIIAAPINIWFKRSEPVGKLKSIDLEDENAESFGVAKIEDFSQKQMLDFLCVRRMRPMHQRLSRVEHRKISFSDAYDFQDARSLNGEGPTLNVAIPLGAKLCNGLRRRAYVPQRESARLFPGARRNRYCAYDAFAASGLVGFGSIYRRRQLDRRRHERARNMGMHHMPELRGSMSGRE